MPARASPPSESSLSSTDTEETLYSSSSGESTPAAAIAAHDWQQTPQPPKPVYDRDQWRNFNMHDSPEGPSEPYAETEHVANLTRYPTPVEERGCELPPPAVQRLSKSRRPRQGELAKRRCTAGEMCTVVGIIILFMCLGVVGYFYSRQGHVRQ